MTAECGKHVTLNCNVSSPRNVLSVKFMEWSLNKTSLCSVDSEGKITKHHISDFHCKYTHGQLALILHKVRPLESANSNYRCKLQSEQGARHGYTTVELQGQSPHLFFDSCHEFTEYSRKTGLLSPILFTAMFTTQLSSSLPLLTHCCVSWCIV